VNLKHAVSVGGSGFNKLDLSASTCRTE